ncbi:MAG: HEPN domain-containing protein [Candidatus Nezhaarchaeales archaeon]
MSFGRDACEQLRAQKIAEFMELAKALFAVAKNDLEVARILYERKFYPQAVFYAEQSAEKIAKTSLLLLFIEDVSSITTCETTAFEDKLKEVHKKLREIGHDVVKLILETCSYIKNKCESYIRDMSKIIDMAFASTLNQSSIQTSAGISAQEILEKFKESFKTICKSAMDSCESFEVGRGKSRDKLFEKLLNMSKDEKELLSFVSDIENIYIMAEYLISVLSPIMLILERNKLRLLPYAQALSAIPISILSLLSPHVTRCRYPEICEDKPSKVCNPLEEYSDENPLVKNLNMILIQMEKIIKSIEYFMNIILKP